MSDILDKILKLKAKADNTDNPAEAEIFSTKVQQLLVEHNLSLDTVEMRKAEKEAQYCSSEGYDMNKYFGRDWYVYLATIVSETTFTRAYGRKVMKPKKGGGQSVVEQTLFAGRPDNVRVACYMYDQLSKRLYNMAMDHGKVTRSLVYARHYVQPSYAQESKHIVVEAGRAFLSGCLIGLYGRLREQFETLREQYGDSLTALAKNEKASIDAYVNPQGSRKTKDLDTRLSPDLRAGITAGQTMPLNQGLESSTASLTKQLQ